MKTSSFRVSGLAIVALSLVCGGAAAAKDKYVECVDPDVGKACMECNQGGTQVGCPEHGTCTVNKLISGSGPDLLISTETSGSSQEICLNEAPTLE